MEKAHWLSGRIYASQPSIRLADQMWLHSQVRVGAGQDAVYAKCGFTCSVCMTRFGSSDSIIVRKEKRADVADGLG